MRGWSNATWAVGVAVLMAATGLGAAALSTPSVQHSVSHSTLSPVVPATTSANQASSEPVAPLYPHSQILGGPPSPVAGPFATRVVGPDLHLAHYPASWGASHLPPGAPIPPVPAGVSPQQFYRTWSGNGSYPLVNGACYGKWPATGQGGYSNNCYGHDEPAINPFSDLPGSGGNVTWTVTLPIDRSPTQNQSDLYTAIWFGMNLNDPYGYSGQCFLELQLYPDTNGNFLSQPGVWSGFAVAWQIELATGFEDPCFAAPLTVGSSSSPFQMNQGDTLTVTMTGWIGSPYGEIVSVVDNTNGLTGGFDLYNTTGRYPLDPAFLANNLDDSLPWSPGGDLPVAFSFEGGHTYGGPSNNTFGGCSSGVPPPTPLNPSTPCDSYDPQSWANDTAQPWLIHPVQFFHGGIRQTATQLGFEQDFGGISWIDPLSLGACQGRDGSAYCSYPWYSYSRAANSVEFGAADYYGMTYDFGQYHQYDSTLTTNTAALGYYPVRNFTVPALVGDSLTIQIPVGGGAVHFLNYTLTAMSTTIPHVPSGSYSINAVPSSGENFLGYTTTGLVAMDAAGTPWNSFRIDGTANITASFGPVAPPTVTVNFAAPGKHGSVAESPGFDLRTIATYPGQIVAQSALVPSTTYSDGKMMRLVPGMYSIQAYPDPGYNFTGWSVTSGVYLFAPHTNYTWINVSSSGGTLTAQFAPTTMTDTVWLETVPATGGQITFDGVTHPSGTILRVPDGVHTLVAVPNASYSFVTWSYIWSASMSNFASSSDVVLQNGTSWVYALFNSTPLLTFTIAGSGGGAISLNGVLRTGTVPLPQVESVSYMIVAAPNAGSSFVGWSVNTPGNLSVSVANVAITSLLVNGTGTLTATFNALPGVALTFNTVGTGSIVWNVNQMYTGSATNSTVAPGLYSIGTVASAGATFAGWTSSSGGISVITFYTLNALGEWITHYELEVTAAGSITATFTVQTFPVTFVDDPTATGTVATFTGLGPAVAIAGGLTASLAAGTYSVALTGGSIPVANWAASSNLSLSATSGLTTSVIVSGSGTLYALAVGLPVISTVTLIPSIVEPNVPFTVTATVAGGTAPLTFSVSGSATLPPGTLRCAPSAFVALTHIVSSVCTATTVGTFPVFANVTDSLFYPASGNAAIQVVGGPAIGFTSPVAHAQVAGTGLPIGASWTNTIATGALPGIEETVALVDDSTGLTVSNTPSATNVGVPALLVSAAASNSVSIAASDLIGPYTSGLPPDQYTVRISAYSTAVLGAGGFPTIPLSSGVVPFTVASLRVLAPLNGHVYPAGNVTFVWDIQVPGNFTGTVKVTNATSVVFTTPVSGSTEAVGPAVPTATPLTLGAGHYYANLTSFNRDAGTWYNLSVSFTVSPATPTSSPPPVYHNSTVYHNLSVLPAYLDALYAGLFVVGLAVGLAVMWVVTRRRRQPPSVVTMTPSRPKPPTPAPAAPSPGPRNVPEWVEDPPSPPRY